MNGNKNPKCRPTHPFYVNCNLVSVILLLLSFAGTHYAQVHIMVKRSADSEITPEECEEQVLETESADAECFKIKKDEKCDEHCNKLGEEKCGGTNGKAYNFQCRNKQKGPKKACCCAYTCESKEETKRRLEKQFAKMREETGGLCTPITYSQEDLQKELKSVCANDDRIHIARKYCLEEKKGEEYFCLKIGECKGKQTQTCLGCVSHECVMQGETDGEIITIPEDYEKERMEKQDFDKSVAGNVEDRKNTVKKDKACTKVKCKDEDCDSKCRELCKDRGIKECGGKALKYGSTVEGKRSGGKMGENKCCCEPVCYPNQGGKSGNEENKEDNRSEDDYISEENASKQENSEEPDGDDTRYSIQERAIEESVNSQDIEEPNEKLLKESQEEKSSPSEQLEDGSKTKSREVKTSKELKEEESVPSENSEDRSEIILKETTKEESGNSVDESVNMSKSSEPESFEDVHETNENDSGYEKDGENQDYTLDNFYEQYGLTKDV